MNKNKKVIQGFIGSVVNAHQLFKYKKANKKHGEYFKGQILKRKFGISPKQSNPNWKKVKIEITIME